MKIFIGTYFLSNNNGLSVPNWVVLNSTSGLLKISTPSVSIATDYSFYVNTMISGLTNTSKKLINLRVDKWNASNCDKWKSDDNTKCEQWSSTYYLSSGKCTDQSSLLIFALSMMALVTVIATAVLELIGNLMNSTSMSSIWTMLNYLQLLVLLLLTRAFMPKDVVNFILNTSISMFVFNLTPFQNTSYFNLTEKWFDDDQSDKLLYKIGLTSGSSLINNYSFFWLLLWTVIGHLMLYIFSLIIKRVKTEGWLSWFIKGLKWSVIAILKILTFSTYIRIILESFQIMLISSISEIFNLNTSSSSKSYSLISAFLIFAFCWLIIWLILVLIWKMKNSEESRFTKYEELFSGLKENTSSRQFRVLHLLRRFLYISILIPLASKSMFIVIWFISVLQAMFFVSIVIFKFIIIFINLNIQLKNCIL